MIDKESIDRLRGSKDFIGFLDYVHESRESAIASLLDATGEQVQQRAGAVCAYKAILDTFDYDRIPRLWERNVP